jgi:hypothetical protein
LETQELLLENGLLLHLLLLHLKHRQHELVRPWVVRRHCGLWGRSTHLRWRGVCSATCQTSHDALRTLVNSLLAILVEEGACSMFNGFQGRSSHSRANTIPSRCQHSTSQPAE